MIVLRSKTSAAAPPPTSSAFALVPYTVWFTSSNRLLRNVMRSVRSVGSESSKPAMFTTPATCRTMLLVKVTSCTRVQGAEPLLRGVSTMA